MGCDFRKGDLHKCVPIIAIGGVLFIIGIALMIVGIVATFRSSDFVAYVGGVSVFFGILFVLVWHMLTIPNIEDLDLIGKKTSSEALKLEDIGNSTALHGYPNPAYVQEKRHDKIKSLRKRSVDGNGNAMKLQSAKQNHGYVEDLEDNIVEAEHAVTTTDV